MVVVSKVTMSLVNELDWSLVNPLVATVFAFNPKRLNSLTALLIIPFTSSLELVLS